MSALRWAGPVLLAVELALVLSGRLALATAAVVLVAVEALLAVVLAGQAVAAARGYRRRRADGVSPAQAAEAAVRAALPGPVATAVLREARLLHALGRWLRRRPDVPPGATALPSGRDERVTGWALLVASLVEMAAVHLLLPWPAVRTVLLVVSAYGTVLLVALLADRAVHPHLLLAEALRLRAGGAVDVTLPLSAVDGVVLRRRRRTAPARVRRRSAGPRQRRSDPAGGLARGAAHAPRRAARGHGDGGAVQRGRPGRRGRGGAGAAGAARTRVHPKC